MTVSQQEPPHELYRAAFAPRPELDAAERARLRRIVIGTDALAVLAGAWVLCAPLVLGYTTADRGPAAFWNAVVIGTAIAVAALVRAGRPFGASPIRVAGLVLGGWLAVAPAVFGAGNTMLAPLGEVAAGLLSAVLALAGLRAATLARRLG